MLFIIDKNIPAPARDSLKNYGEVIEFSTQDLTYTEVSNHPDIFFCKLGDIIVYAPNTPLFFIEELSKRNVRLIRGESPVGLHYPESAIYNAVVTDRYFIHNYKISDAILTNTACDKELLNVKQGYTRCSLLPLRNDSFITSDIGICNKLLTERKEVLLVDPQSILLPGRNYGFFGGTSGVHQNKVFITGKLSYFPEGAEVQDYLQRADYEIIELYDGPLYDCGSILIINN